MQVRRIVTIVAALALALLGLVTLPLPVALAAYPVNPMPTMVTADALPTVQINGVVWKQVIAGNVVYAGGEFTKARPAGAAPGTNEVNRSDLLAYNLQSGELISSFAPTLNGKVSDMAVTPDGTKLVVVGDFTQVNSVTRNRVAIFNLPSGTLSSVAPGTNGNTKSVAATNSTVYVGGYFSYLNSTPRSHIGAFNINTGATLPFAVPVDDGQVQSIVVSPDGSQVVFSGSFTSVGGSSDPGYGLARVDAVDGTMLPLPVNDVFRDAGPSSSVLRLASDNDSFYGTGWHYNSAGTSEGSFRASWSDGSLVWLEDCHGDTYDVASVNGVVYEASHHHYCGNSGGFPQTNPWSYYHSTAWTKTVEGTNTSDIYGYPDHPGTPRPELLNWFPQTDIGSYTGQNQAVWTVTGNSQYVIYGGEFPKVNGTPQQGIVRYAVRSIAPNKQGPRLQGGTTSFDLGVRSLAAGTARITWPALWDRDDSDLTYQVYRNDMQTKVYETTQNSRFWETHPMVYTDTGLAPGSSVRYRVRALDPSGNYVDSGWFSVTVSATGSLGAYATAVLADGATKYWRLDDPSGATADWAGADDGVTGSGVTRGAAGALLNDTDTASTFDGTSNGLVASTVLTQGPNTFSLEAWFKTTSTSGGKIVGFGNSNSGDSSAYDRHIFMDGSGAIVFGVYPGGPRTVQSAPGLNDGQWHQVVGTLGSKGMVLYVDGKKVAADPSVTSAQDYSGYWRVGGDSSWSGANYFTGDIDDVSIYPTQLTGAQVDGHWAASGRPSTIPQPPADAYGAAVFHLDPDFYWRLDETSGTTAADSGPAGTAGSVQGGATPGVPGALDSVAHTAYSFDGSSGAVVSSAQTSNPQNYSEGLWFKTTTTSGGKLIGFGNASSGTSSNYDRHVYMRDDGTLQFGVWTGFENNIITPQSYNDGAWHFVVATQSTTDGMKLYVDGQLVGTNPQTSAQDYSGYWRIGGDTLWEGSTSQFFNGALDEASVFDQVLTPTQIAQLYSLGSGANAKPTAAFTSDAGNLDVTFDGSGSSDPDGAVASYAWDFGDGATATTQKPEHTYAAAGDYNVTLTVTDDAGATDSVTHTVTVTAPPPNQKPTAAFTFTTSNLAAAFDGSGSSDSDGSVASYAWDFGDGATGTTEKSTHTYAAAGDYNVTLTVTDDAGATDSVTHTVTVTAPSADQLASDDFQRTVSNGWGTANVGGAWTNRGGSASSRKVADGAGQLTVPSGATLSEDLNDVSATSARVTVEFSVDKVLEANYVAITGRQVGSNVYAFRLRIAADGSAKLYLLRNGDTQIGSVYNLPAGSVVAGAHYILSGQVSGTSPTTLSAKVWKASDPEPTGWQRTGTDSTAALQAAGTMGVFSYLSPSTAGGPVSVSFYDVEAVKP